MTTTNPNMRRTLCRRETSDITDIGKNVDSTIRDRSYVERREKNNAAARMSRERRKITINNMKQSAAFMEAKNAILRAKLDKAKTELEMARIKYVAVRSGLKQQ